MKIVLTNQQKITRSINLLSLYQSKRLRIYQPAILSNVASPRHPQLIDHAQRHQRLRPTRYGSQGNLNQIKTLTPCPYH